MVAVEGLFTAMDNGGFPVSSTEKVDENRSLTKNCFTDLTEIGHYLLIGALQSSDA